MPPFQPLRLQKVEETAEAGIELTWSDGRVNRHRFRDLRIACQCAACRDELTGARILNPASVPETIRPETIEPVGSYALRFIWSDGHSSGIYPFQFLYREGAPALREAGIG